MLTKHLTKTQNAIGLLVIFCIVLQLIRVQYTQSLFFSFLLWNLFLAFIPYGISEWIKKKQPQKKVFLFLLVVWLLFLPNSPYIITDFVHLHHSKSTMLWYDLFLIFCFANTGLILAIVSMNDMYTMIQQQWTAKIANKSMIVITFLCGFGIYLGRFLRFNSWDLVTHPFSIIKQSFTSLTNSTAWFITVGFASLLWLLLSVFRSFIEAKGFR